MRLARHLIKHKPATSLVSQAPKVQGQEITTHKVIVKVHISSWPSGPYIILLLHVLQFHVLHFQSSNQCSCSDDDRVYCRRQEAAAHTGSWT